jgi:hypothetical protein
MPQRDKESASRSEVLNLRDRESGFRDVDDAIIEPTRGSECSKATVIRRKESYAEACDRNFREIDGGNQGYDRGSAATAG